MQNTKSRKLFSLPLFNTKISSANVKWKESCLGYLIGPFGGMLTSQVFTVYLNTYWTDVLGLDSLFAGTFLSVFPLISVLFIAIGNFIVGRLVDRTKTRQGKARPYLLISAVLMAITSVLVFAVPASGEALQLAWIAVSYNLYYAVAYPLYSASNTLMIPLSTRNGNHRNRLSSFANLAGTGASSFATIVLPMIVAFFNFGVDRRIWLIFMCVVAVISFCFVVVQYYYTRERVTEENMRLNIAEEKIPFSKQFKALFTNKFWILTVLMFFIFQFVGSMQNFSMVYYCNWVLGTYQDGTTQTLLGLITGIPMTVGVVFVGPLAKKFGKTPSMSVGLLIASAGCLLALLFPKNYFAVYGGLILKSLGMCPMVYLIYALIADVLDHVEAKNGFRCDGLSVAVTSIMMSVLLCICQGIFNAMTLASGYVKPVQENISDLVQNQATQNVIVWCYVGFMMIGYAVCAVMAMFVKVEKHLDEDHKTILERQKAAVLAAGGEWIEPAERLRMEQEEADRLAEEARIAELKAHCEKRGLSFEEQEAKYQAKKRKKGG